MSTHHGFLREFPFIRVDAFNGDPAVVNPYTGQGPTFSLLSHAHTDHLTGLDSPRFDGFVYCTPVTRELVMGSMTAGERVRAELHGNARVYKFAGLRGRDGQTGRMKSDKIVSHSPTTLIARVVTYARLMNCRKLSSTICRSC